MFLVSKFVTLSSHFCQTQESTKLEEKPYCLLHHHKKWEKITPFWWCRHSTSIRKGNMANRKTFTTSINLNNFQQVEHKINVHTIRLALLMTCLKVTFIMKNPVGTVRPHMQLFARMTKRDREGTAQCSGHECSWYLHRYRMPGPA